MITFSVLPFLQIYYAIPANTTLLTKQRDENAKFALPAQGVLLCASAGSAFVAENFNRAGLYLIIIDTIQSSWQAFFPDGPAFDISLSKNDVCYALTGDRSVSIATELFRG